MRFRSRPDASDCYAVAPKMMRSPLWKSAQWPLVFCLGTTLCGGALFVGPLYANPLVGQDENGPQVQILSPGYNDVIKGNRDISLSIKAGNYNPATIEMFVNDKSATGGPIPLQNLGTSFGWDTRQFPDGPHKLTVRVTDTQGFRGWAEVNVFINNNRVVDDIAPSLNWRNVKKEMTLSGRAQIQLDASDFFGVKLVKITINSATDPNRKPAIATWLLNKPPYIANFDSTLVPDGTYYLRAEAWDASEQQGIAPSLRIGVLNNPLNAQSVREQMEGLSALDNAVAESAKPKPKVNPLGENPRVATLPGLGKVIPKVATAPENQKPAVPGALSAREEVRDGARNVPAEKVVVAAPGTSQPLKATPPVAAARLLPGTATKAAGQLSPAKSPRVAEIASPEAGQEIGVAALSAAKTPEILASREFLASAKPELKGEFNSRFPSLPLTERNDVLESPTLSSPDVPRLALAGGIETTVTGETSRDAEGKIAAPRVQTRFFGEEPTLSEVGATVATRLVPGLEVKAVAEAPSLATIARLSAPEEVQRPVVDASEVSVPVGDPAVTSQPLLSAAPKREMAAVQDPKAALKNVRDKIAGALSPSKTHAVKVPVMPRVQVAALPKTTRSNAPAITPSITVTPLALSAQKMPTSHRVERVTTLRAVAARYGLPVELVAVCNNWPVEMTVVKGMIVELPRPLQVSYAGQPVASDTHSMLVGGTGVTAFRFLFEQAGGKIEWDAKNKRVVARKGATEIVLSIGSKVAKVGDQETMMELAAFLFEGRTMVPVRLFEQGLSAQVEWDPQTGRMVIAMLSGANAQG